MDLTRLFGLGISNELKLKKESTASLNLSEKKDFSGKNFSAEKERIYSKAQFSYARASLSFGAIRSEEELEVIRYTDKLMNNLLEGKPIKKTKAKIIKYILTDDESPKLSYPFKLQLIAEAIRDKIKTNENKAKIKEDRNLNDTIFDIVKVFPEDIRNRYANIYNCVGTITKILGRDPETGLPNYKFKPRITEESNYYSLNAYCL